MLTGFFPLVCLSNEVLIIDRSQQSNACMSEAQGLLYFQSIAAINPEMSYLVG